MTAIEERRYRYVPRVRVLVLAILFFGLCAVFMFYLAATNRQALTIDRILHLDPGQADVFYVVIGVLSALFVAFGVVANVAMRVRPRFVVIGPTALGAPGSLFRAPSTIAWKDILSIHERTVHRQRFLEIRHRGGKAAIAATMLGDAYEEVRAIITAHAG